MIDKRFYNVSDNVSASQLADAGQGSLVRGNADKCVASFASAETAESTDLTFLENAKSIKAENVKAGVCFAPADLAEAFPEDVVVITSDSPRWSFSKAASLIASPIQHWAADTIIHPSAQIEDGARIGANVVIGPNAKIGGGTTIRPGTVIGAGVAIGRSCQIGSNVTISCALIGDAVTILSGTTVGENGFGLSPGPDGALDTPHFGRVIIQDKVSIGANVCVPWSV